MASETDLILHVIEKTTGNALREGAGDLDHLAGSADDADGSMRNLGKGTGFVDSEIVRLRGHIRDLSAEIDRTGNTSLFKDLRADESSLRKFQNLAKTLTSVGQAGGKEFNKGFLSTLGDLGGNLRGAIIPAVIGAAVALAPPLGGMIAGAVVGAAGIGGIAGGIAMASRDPQVQAAATEFGRDIVDEFFAGGDAFVQPILEGLDILRTGFRNLELDDAFKPLAESVPKLAEAFAGFATSMMPGLARAFEAAVPAVEVLADQLPRVGDALGDMFADISDGEDALTGLRTILAVVEGTIRATGATIEFLSERWHDFLGVLQSGAGILEDFVGPVAEDMGVLNDALAIMTGTSEKVSAQYALIPGRMQNTADVAEHLSARFQDQAEAANLAFRRLSDLNKAYDDAVARQQDLMGASINFEEAIDDLTASFEDNGTSLDITKAKGRENMKVVQDAIREARNMRQATFEQTGSWTEANRVYNIAIGKLEGVARKAGISAAKLREMAGNYQINITQTTRFVNVGSPPDLSRGGLGRLGPIASFAEGGWVQGPVGSPQIIQAHGGEFVLSRDMLKGAAGPQKMTMPGAGGRAPMGGQRLAPISVSGHSLGQAVLSWLQHEIRTQYGGDVVAALGQ